MSTTALTHEEFARASQGYRLDPANSGALHADAYVKARWADIDREAIFARTWQWICHVEVLREPGSYITATVAGHPILCTRDQDGHLRAHYNVCSHRAHELLNGQGTTRSIVCPYHAWTYDLAGNLKACRLADRMPEFDYGRFHLTPVHIEEFGGFIYVNLDPAAESLSHQAPDLAEQIAHWAPDVSGLTLAKRLTYTIESNWKNVIDNFLECYHCHIAHREFVDLVDMDTYRVQTYGIWSSHFAEAGKQSNSAYDVSGATVKDHAVWWLWPNTCLLRYPGRGNFMVLQVVPDGPGRTRETWDFYLESTDLTPEEIDSVRYIDEVLQVQDIGIVESVQRGMATPAYETGRIVYDPAGSGLSEHGVHHFHGLVLEAYRSLLEA